MVIVDDETEILSLPRPTTQEIGNHARQTEVRNR